MYIERNLQLIRIFSTRVENEYRYEKTIRRECRIVRSEVTQAGSIVLRYSTKAFLKIKKTSLVRQKK